ncbi:MAG TPA: NAD(P)H-quinone oxidoreductase [Candidatus Baltobacteraceae bacterium]|jgi:putative PIG3 family NAD(P)H quinone oxidoreductase|nr:NAD(P)H-quinone oxidoreductase [Candidatus Baltobacteraceae bacterium]
MRAVEILQPGGPEVLRVVERPTPVPADGEVLIQVKAAGVSRADTMQRQGKYPPPPGSSDIPGLEVAGVIDGTQERVCALLTGGGYAEYVAAARKQVLPIPENWDFVEAATLPENMFTVYDNLFTRGMLREGERVLVHGGSSGIGTTAIMLAKAFGAAFVAATAGSKEKCDACLGLGANIAINYKTSDFVEAIHTATNGRGVDVVLDIVGGDYIARDLDALAADGRVVCIATPRGRTAEINLGALMQKRAAVMASALRARSVEQKHAIAARLLHEVWPKLPARSPIRPVVDSTFPLEDAAAAHRRLEESAHVGKIVLVT